MHNHLPPHILHALLAPCLTLHELRAWRCIDSGSAQPDSAVSVAARRAHDPTLYAAVDKLYVFFSRSVAIHQKGLVQSSIDFITTPPRDKTQQLSLTDVIALERLIRGDVADALRREMAAWHVLTYLQSNGNVLHLTVLSVLQNLYGKGDSVRVLFGPYAHTLYLHARNHNQQYILPKNIVCDVAHTSDTPTVVNAYSWGFYVRMTTNGLHTPVFENTPQLRDACASQP